MEKRIENWAVIKTGISANFVARCLARMGMYKNGTVYYQHLTTLETGSVVMGIYNGELIRTSPIVAFDGNSVTTASGNIYKLGKKHPDYVLFENTLLKDYPIIRDWSMGFLYDDQWTPYYMEGTIYHWHTKKHIAKEIASQNLEERTVTFTDGTTAFVDYLAMSSKQIEKFHSAPDVELESFCGIRCVPNFAETKWYQYGTGVANHRDELNRSDFYIVYSH